METMRSLGLSIGRCHGCGADLDEEHRQGDSLVAHCPVCGKMTPITRDTPEASRDLLVAFLCGTIRCALIVLLLFLPVVAIVTLFDITTGLIGLAAVLGMIALFLVVLLLERIAAAVERPGGKGGVLR